MSIQGEEMEKINYTPRVEKESTKGKKWQGKLPKWSIIWETERKEWRKQMWSVKTETESRWKEIEGKSRDVFQCFNAGKKYVGNNKQEGKETSSTEGALQASTQLLPGWLWGLPSKGLGRKLLSCLNIPAVCGSLPFLLQFFTDPSFTEVNEVARSSIRDSCVVLMIPDADITKPVTGGDWSWLEKDTSVTYRDDRTNGKMEVRDKQDQEWTKSQSTTSSPRRREGKHLRGLEGWFCMGFTLKPSLQDI